ncbi:hypothetical protein [Mycobacterium avium]
MADGAGNYQAVIAGLTNESWLGPASLSMAGSRCRRSSRRWRPGRS